MPGMPGRKRAGNSWRTAGKRSRALKGCHDSRGSGGAEAGQISGTGPASEPASGAGNPADNAGEQKKPTGMSI